MELQGRVALVTGGAGGIGGAVVRGLAKAGISGVAVNYRKSGKEAEELAAEIERKGSTRWQFRPTCKTTRKCGR